MASSAPFIAHASEAMRQTDGEPLAFRLGIASYSLRNFEIEKVLKATKRLGISAICFKSMHLPLDADAEQIGAVIKMFRDEGVDVYGGGVIYMKNRKEADQACEYARMAGRKIIVGVPDHEILSYVEEKVKKYDIKLAIHNHGPGDEKYPSPGSAFERIKDMDPRMGLCIDIGHTARIGLDPAGEIEKYFPRVLDIHFKDVTLAEAEGKTCIAGQGVIDIPRIIKTLIRLDYTQTLALEYEAEEDDPLAGMARSFGYVQGVAAALGYELL